MTKQQNFVFKGIIDTDKYSYTLSISRSYKIVNEEMILYDMYVNLGSYTTNNNEKKTCVDIYIMYPEAKKELPFINYKLAKLITTHYNEKCSIDEKLKRGEGTQHMINTAMYLSSKMCPFIEGFEINDASTRQCDNNTTIALSYFSITNYKKTWYEKNFGAFIGETNKRNKYNMVIESLFSLKLSEWEIFSSMFLRNTSKSIKDIIKSQYDKSITYNDLFKNIHKLGIDKACIYLQPWIENLMLTTDLRNYVLFTQWIIPISSIKSISLTNYKKNFFGKLENYVEKN
jgi:hypothetical protein